MEIRRPVTEWDENELLKLIGEMESMTLDFKQSLDLNKDPEKSAKDLTKVASAFANTEGGIIVIGMEEEKQGKMRIAKGLDDGVDPNVMWPERLQQKLESNLNPYLTGIRYKGIQLSGSKAGRIAIVVAIPKGVTAYQAGDRLYYGRKEWECVALPDSEIRLLMMRGKIRKADLQIVDVCLSPNSSMELKSFLNKLNRNKEDLERYRQGAKQLRGEGPLTVKNWEAENQLKGYEREIQKLDRFIGQIEGIKDNAYYFRFSFVVQNVGEVTLEDFALEVNFEPVLLPGLLLDSDDKELTGKILLTSDHFGYPHSSIRKLYPSSKTHPAKAFSFIMGRHTVLRETRITWRLFLDGILPSEGEINFDKQLRRTGAIFQ